MSRSIWLLRLRAVPEPVVETFVGLWRCYEGKQVPTGRWQEKSFS